MKAQRAIEKGAKNGFAKVVARSLSKDAEASLIDSVSAAVLRVFRAFFACLQRVAGVFCHLSELRRQQSKCGCKHANGPNTMRRMQTLAFLPRGHSTARQRAQAGFSLMELMAVLTVLAILATFAAPSFTQMTERWRVRQTAESMVSSLYYARSEAIKRGGFVAMSRLPANSDCNHASSNNNWGCGWRVFYDKNRNGTFDASGDEVLQLSDAPAKTNVIVKSGSSILKFDRWGQVNGISAQGIVITPASGNSSGDSAITLCVSSGGRIDMRIGAISC